MHVIKVLLFPERLFVPGVYDYEQSESRQQCTCRTAWCYGENLILITSLKRNVLLLNKNYSAHGTQISFLKVESCCLKLAYLHSKTLKISCYKINWSILVQIFIVHWRVKSHLINGELERMLLLL